MEQVKQMIAAGVGITTAIKQALANNGLTTVTAFAEKYRLNRSVASNHLSGLVRATDDTIAALVVELGGSASEWAELLWLAGKPSGFTEPKLAANQ